MQKETLKGKHRKCGYPEWQSIPFNAVAAESLLDTVAAHDFQGNAVNIHCSSENSAFLHQVLTALHYTAETLQINFKILTSKTMFLSIVSTA